MGRLVSALAAFAANLCLLRRLQLAAAATSVGVVLGSSAQAATVGRVSDPPGFPGRPGLAFQAALGEQNRVTVSRTGESEYRFEDGGAALAAGDSCRTTEDSHVVLCRPPGRGEPGLAVGLGDRNDTLRLFVRGAFAYGGSGDDELVGGPGFNVFGGGGGDDVLVGGPGADELNGDGANREGTPDSDRGDTLGNDNLRGGRGRDLLDGGPGEDQLSGGSGNDALFGDGQGLPFERPGADVIRGGAGLDMDVYSSPRRTPPGLSVTFDGLSNDGRPGERDNVTAGVERAYSIAQARRNSGGFGFGRSAASLEVFGRVQLRAYRLSRQGTARAGTGVFEGEDLTVRESRSRKRPTHVSLPKGGFERCRAAARTTRRQRRSRRVIHRLRARGRGRFRTQGRYAAATVRGTDWTVTDRCDGTLTTVRVGTVLVRDLRRRRTISLRAAMSYLARAPR